MIHAVAQGHHQHEIWTRRWLFCSVESSSLYTGSRKTLAENVLSFDGGRRRFLTLREQYCCSAIVPIPPSFWEMGGLNFLTPCRPRVAFSFLWPMRGDLSATSRQKHLRTQSPMLSLPLLWQTLKPCVKTVVSLKCRDPISLEPE